MSLKYKIGDKVVLGDAETLKGTGIDLEYAHETAIIDEIEDNICYRVVVEKDGEDWHIDDDEIDHEATAKLNNKSNDDPIGGVMSIDMSSYITRRIDCEGGETMNANEILDTWGNKKCKELRYKADAEKDKISAQDEIRKLILDHKAQINETLKEKFKVDTEVDYVFNVLITEKTRKKLEEIEEKVKIEEDKVNKKVKEIKAVLEVAENQDKVFEILNKQGIIDKNYNIL